MPRCRELKLRPMPRQLEFKLNKMHLKKLLSESQRDYFKSRLRKEQGQRRRLPGPELRQKPRQLRS